MISFNGYPFLDTKEEHTFHVSVSSVMTPVSNISLLPSSGLSFRALEALLRKSSFQGFPVVEDRASRILLGYIGRTELRYAIDKTKKEQSLDPNAKCLFCTPGSTAVRTPSALTPPITFEQTFPSSSIETVDFSRFVDPTPLAVHPRLALETVMELFKKMGPRVILVELKGRLIGLVTVKDCLKYQFKVEAQERGGEGESGADHIEAWLWENMRRMADWARALMARVSGGRIRLGLGEVRGESLLTVGSHNSRYARESIDGAVGREEEERGILGGTENDEEGLELTGR